MPMWIGCLGGGFGVFLDLHLDLRVFGFFVCGLLGLLVLSCDFLVVALLLVLFLCLRGCFIGCLGFVWLIDWFVLLEFVVA